MRAHPVYRAVRLDKMTLAALEVTLRLLREGQHQAIPVREMLAKTAEACRLDATQIADAVPGATVEEDVGYSGGGALPDAALPTFVVAIRGGDLEAQVAALRGLNTPIVARVGRDALIVDPRTLLPNQVLAVIDGLNQVLGLDTQP